MNQHKDSTQEQALARLIDAVQQGKRIQAIKAVQALLLNGRAVVPGRSSELKRSIELVKSIWLDMRDRPAYIAGMFDPATFERNHHGEEEKEPEGAQALPEERNEDPFGCAALEAQWSGYCHDQAFLLPSADDEA